MKGGEIAADLSLFRGLASHKGEVIFGDRPSPELLFEVSLALSIFSE
jgi:hypothetical protein